MLALVTGGSASGKSEYAEGLVQKLAQESKQIYLATMQPFDAECEERIARHRAMRKSKGFETIEQYTGLSGVSVMPGSIVLLECMSNLVANELFSPQGAQEHALKEILQGVEKLCHEAKHVVVVSNELFSDGVSYSLETERYVALLGAINQALAAKAQLVVEVVYSLPVFHKLPKGSAEE